MAFSRPTADELTPYKDLTGQVTKTEEHYFAYGGFSEVFKGGWADPATGNVRRVAIKLLRGVHTDDQVLVAITRRLNRETRVWHSLSHANILPFLGVCSDLGPSTAMVSPLCDNGAVLQYLGINPQANRLKIIIGVARGLKYLHSRDVVHGDLKGHNVLMSDDGIPLLADFGRSKFIDHRGFTTSFAGSARYLAPELVSDEPDIDDSAAAYEAVEEQTPAANLTKETDVFAFSMVALEILTGQIPYFYLRQDSTVIALVQEGTRPDRDRCLPTTFTEPMWMLLVNCWKADPKERPDMKNVVQFSEALDNIDY
jgi:serine/threonine protein kinase